MKTYRFDLQFFADGAHEGGAAAGEGAQTAGGSAADAGQEQSAETRLSQLGVPADRIERYRRGKGALRPDAAPAPEAAAEPADGSAADAEGEESGDAGRRPWDEIRAEYKEELDAETQGIVKKRLKNLREKLRQYEERESKTAVLTDFLAARYGMDPDELDLDRLLEAFRNDAGLSEAKANELGTSDEIAHRLELAEQEEARRAREERRQRELRESFERRAFAERHFDELQTQAEALREKLPDFDLMAALEDDAFAELTRPGSRVSVEAAYYALHPELRQAEAEAVAQRAREAVSASVRAGAERPRETGAQAASLGRMPYREMPREQREELKRRIREAACLGRHIPYGG